ncbi:MULTISPECIES: hypothetical protein [Pontibacter]|nr:MULTISPECIES: hypothetical protein [Pontibacter]
MKFRIVTSIYSLNWEALRCIVAIVPKGQGNLPCSWSVTIEL